MDYFIILPDERISLYKDLDYSVPGFRQKEPFVTYGKFDVSDRYPDFFYGKSLFDYYFCVTDRLKEIFDVYSSNLQAVPFFLTDEAYRSQVVCWKIECSMEECIAFRNSKEEWEMTLRKSRGLTRYLLRVRKEKAQYMVVSMELAENMLRRHLYGIRFVPVKINWKESNVYENNNS
ncbi:hypothetical protein [Lacrimispora sp. JR3]|uniref:hypothetical protein n=1 Tax=Lacrimispora sinapis TaxID=3111456 RepID=UPI003747BD74